MDWRSKEIDPVSIFRLRRQLLIPKRKVVEARIAKGRSGWPPCRFVKERGRIKDAAEVAPNLLLVHMIDFE